MRAYSREIFKHKYSPNAAFGRPKFSAKSVAQLYHRVAPLIILRFGK